jgi:hypothetical protein
MIITSGLVNRNIALCMEEPGEQCTVVFACKVTELARQKHRYALYCEKSTNRRSANRKFFQYFIQHCFICRPSDSSVSEDAGIEGRYLAEWCMDEI